MNGTPPTRLTFRRHSGLLLLSGFMWTFPAAGKPGPTIFTAERVANARKNIATYAWAAQQREAVLAAAAPWAALSDRELWEMVPEQALPRSATIRAEHTCPNCGTKADRHGPYAWKTDPLRHPWKVICPGCGQVFPKNDFGAYYRSGKGAEFLWSPQRSDKSLLVNTDPATAAKGKHYAVDDGFGWVDEQGRRYAFIAYYCHWGLWRQLQAALTSLSEAYLFTGQGRYAHKAAVLLARIADLYPAFDHLPLYKLGLDNASGGTGQGKIYGRLWETGICTTFILALDRVWDNLDNDKDLTAFLTEQAARYQLSDQYRPVGALKQHLLRGIVDATVQGLYDGRIRGYQGAYQAAMIRAALTLADPKRTPRLLGWVFAPETEWPAKSGHQMPAGQLPAVLTDLVDRDGFGTDGAPEYALAWLSDLHDCADLLAGARGAGRRDLYHEFPKLHRMFTAPVRLALLGRWAPNIGDTGQTGRNRRVGWNRKLLLAGFRRWGDKDLAQAAWELNGRTVAGMHTSIFDPNPEAIQKQVQAAVTAAPRRWTSRDLPGFGLAALQSGRDKSGRALWIYYGRNFSHGHRDRLNLGLFAHGLNLLPDLGSPEFMGPWPKRIGWTSHTVSHNTVMVDHQPQRPDWGGTPTLFATLPGVSVVEIASPGVYSQCRVYQRQTALIDVDDDNSYAVDFFRVEGGHSHTFSFHAAEGRVRVTGVKLHRQPHGTLAGEDVAFGAWKKETPTWAYAGPGFQYLYDVSRGQATQPVSVDWAITDTWGQRDEEGTVHVRLTLLLTQPGDLVLASGDPPQNKQGNPRRLRYVLLERRGESLRSDFVSLIEPYVARRVVRSAKLLYAESGATGIEIDLPDNRTDYVYSSTSPETRASLTPKFTVAARFALVRTKGDEVESLTLVGGTLLRFGPFMLSHTTPEWTGVIDDFDREEDTSNCLYTTTELPPGNVLAGQEIRLENDGARNAVYTIREVHRDGGRTVIDLGDVTFVRRFRDSHDYAAGVVYNFKAGCRFAIPTHVRLVRSAPGIYRATFTAPVDVELPAGQQLGGQGQ